MPPKPFTAPIGTSDTLPADHDYFNFVKKILRYRFRQSGFRRISTPIFENTKLFHSALGMDNEIVKRELFSFEDPIGKEMYALRPEMTTGIVRSFIEEKMNEGPLPVEFYSLERCFRFERPKSRTKREFWQVGAEILGESDPAIDAQVIYLGYRILKDIGILDDLVLKINTIGTPDDRKRFFEALEDFYSSKRVSLSASGKEKFEKGQFLDLLNATNENEQILAEMAPKITSFLSESSQEFFRQTLEYLDTFGIPYEIDHSLTRPLPYYSHTVFEFRQKGTPYKVLVGGRYDGLMKKLSGPDLGGAGFAGGIERMISLMKEKEIEVPRKDSLQIYVAATGAVAKCEALKILVKLREFGFHAIGVLGKVRMEEQMNRASKFNIPYAVILGELEAKKGVLRIRDVRKGKTEEIEAKDLLLHMEKLLGAPKKMDCTKDFLSADNFSL